MAGQIDIINIDLEFNSITPADPNLAASSRSLRCGIGTGDGDHEFDQPIEVIGFTADAILLHDLLDTADQIRPYRFHCNVSFFHRTGYVFGTAERDSFVITQGVYYPLQTIDEETNELVGTPIDKVSITRAFCSLDDSLTVSQYTSGGLFVNMQFWAKRSFGTRPESPLKVGL